MAQDVKSCLELLDQFLKQPNTIVLSMMIGKQEKSRLHEFKSLSEAVAHVLGRYLKFIEIIFIPAEDWFSLVQFMCL